MSQFIYLYPAYLKLQKGMEGVGVDRIPENSGKARYEQEGDGEGDTDY